MTYLICKDNIQEQEILERQKYIYEVFNIYTFVNLKQSSLVVLKSIPTTDIDLFFIIGHNNATDNYLKDHYREIKENNILIIACYTKNFLSIKLLKDKKIYIPKNEEKINIYYGKDYGFEFDITDEEILIYRKRRLKLEEILGNIFRRK